MYFPLGGGEGVLSMVSSPGKLGREGSKGRVQGHIVPYSGRKEGATLLPPPPPSLRHPLAADSHTTAAATAEKGTKCEGRRKRETEISTRSIFFLVYRITCG